MHQHHLRRRRRRSRSMGEIASSLVAVVLVMCSVFIPAAFLPGTTGQLYKQFAITIVISVAVSGFIALTLTPAMCAAAAEAQSAAAARLLRVVQPPGRPRDAAASATAVDATSSSRGRGARAARGVPVLDLSPLQRSCRRASCRTRTRATRSRRSSCRRRRASTRTQEIAEQGGRDIQGRSPACETRTVVTGYSLLDSGFKTNAGTIFVTFKDFNKRYENIDTAKKENVRAILQALFRARRGMIEGAIVDPDRAAGDSRHRHHRRLRVLDPGHGHRRSRRARRRDAGLPQEGARAARADRPRDDVFGEHAAAAAPTSTATRRSCWAFRSRTCTARSRRSSARSRSASTTSSPTSGGWSCSRTRSSGRTRKT